MGNVVKNVTATTTEDELQVRNGLDSQRVFDPAVYKLMNEVLKELRNIKNELISIKEGE
jgi:hypothetical protein